MVTNRIFTVTGAGLSAQLAKGAGMDALMAAFVAALLIQLGDRNAWFAAILADRYGKPIPVIAAATIGIAATNALGVVAALLMAPILTPNARALMLALALLSAGGSALFASKHPGQMDGWRLGAFATSLIGMLAIGVGDRLQFVTAGLALASPLPWFAAIGATIGSVVVIVPAAMLGERRWLALPITAIRMGTGGVLIIAGLWTLLGALRLI